MTRTDKRLPANTLVRERVDRLLKLHRQLHTLTTDTLARMKKRLRNLDRRSADEVLNEEVKRYIQRLHTHQLRVESEFSILGSTQLISDQELVALIGPFPSENPGQKDQN